MTISLLVDPAQDVPHDASHDEIPNHIPQRDAMSNNISWHIPATIQLSADDRTQVADSNLQSVCHSALGLSGYIHGRPGERESYCRVNAGSCKEDASVRHPGTLHRVSIAEKDAVTYDSGQGAKEDEGSAALHFL